MDGWMDVLVLVLAQTNENKNKLAQTDDGACLGGHARRDGGTTTTEVDGERRARSRHDDDGERAMEANDGRFLSPGARLRTDAGPTRWRGDFNDERELGWEFGETHGGSATTALGIEDQG